jgi:CsoR family transcriptional regulator, copper-sensing transcriptional repressor
MQAETKADVLQRLKTVQGHVAGLSRMVEQGEYCIDILNQVVAIQRSLGKVAGKVLENHLQTCVKRALSDTSGADSAERERVIDELLAVYEKATSL